MYARLAPTLPIAGDAPPGLWRATLPGHPGPGSWGSVGSPYANLGNDVEVNLAAVTTTEQRC